KPPEWWEKQKGSRGIRRGQWYRLVFQFPIREQSRATFSQPGSEK
ncbi:transcriptional regulator, partial [Escherichia coli]